MSKIGAMFAKLRFVLIAVCVALFSSGAFAACTSSQIDVNGDGTQCETVKFSVTTISDATSLVWTMTAVGTFYADCGDGGTLTQDTSSYGTVSGNTITRTSTSQTTYTCTWGSAGAHTVRFGGTATGYSTATNAAAISFYKDSGGTQEKLASIDGSLGAMFPVVNGNIPRFYMTFYYCTNLTQIPAGLFDSIDTSSATNTSNMFSYTFYNTKITSIPAGLFDSIDTSSATNTSSMFSGTFNGCTNLTQIPAGLFSTIDTSSATNTSDMFYQTFRNTPITSIPAGLFSGIDTSSATDTNCMFLRTFSGCTNLTQIPAGLFDSIDTSKSTDTDRMFYRTFYDCTNLTGYIPPTAFPKTIKPGTTSSSDMWKQTFYGTNLATTCPAGTTEYNSGFENDWGYSNGNTATDGTYRVSCEPCAGTLPGNATYTTGTCNWSCNTGYGLTDTNACAQLCTAGVTQLHTSTGLAFNLYANKLTSPAVHIKTDTGAVCYVNLATGNATGAVHFRVGDTIYHTTN